MVAVPTSIIHSQRGSVDGILNLNKPAGLTSHDVVNRIRRLTGERKVGHAGTLDPMATGVLLVCLGRATRVAEYLTSGRKHYRATVRLGISTDTYDADGHVTAHTSGINIDLSQIELAVAPWRGVVKQVPPAYSAIHFHGKRLYQLARKGEALSPEPRTVEIYTLNISAWRAPLLTLEVECSPGTYIRSLAHDLGQALGVGAHLASLVRLATGQWTIGDSTSLKLFDEDVAENRWQQHLHPIDEALVDLNRIDLSPEMVNKVLQGLPIQVTGYAEQQLLRAYSPNNEMIAILRLGIEPDLWHPNKVFHPREKHADNS